MVLYYHHTPAGQKHVKPRMNPGSPAPRSQSPSAQPALPPSYSLAAGLGGGTESLPPRPPARRSFSAPGLPVHSLVDESISYVTGAQLVANTRLPRHAVGVGVPVDNDSVPPAAMIAASSRRQGLSTSQSFSGPSGISGISTVASAAMTKALRQSESAARLATPPPRDIAGLGQWTYYDETAFPGFSHDLAQLPTRCSTAFQSKQLRLINESKGDTYLGKDPRALLADGSYAGYRLDHQYAGSDLLQSNSTTSLPSVSAYSRTGIVRSNGPRLRPSPKSISAASDIVLGSRRPRKGGAKAYTDAAYSSSAMRRSPSFVSRTERFLPSRTWAGSDPRAVMADDPFDGVHPHQYQVHDGGH